MIKFKFPYKFPLEVKRDEERNVTVIKSQFFEIETDDFNLRIEQGEIE